MVIIAIIIKLCNNMLFSNTLFPLGNEKSFLGENFYIVFFALIYWLLGYFAPEATSRIPLKFLNTYILLPIWLNGIFRKKRSTSIPDGVVSTIALGAQFGALFLLLLYIGFRFHWSFLENRFMGLYGLVLCIFLGVSCALIISKFRPYPPRTE